MYCPKCNSENSDSAKFCKKCGTPLQSNVPSHGAMMNNINNEKSGDNTTKIIIIALIVVAIVLAGAFVYIYGFSNNNDNQVDNSQSIDTNDTGNTVKQATQTSQSAPKTQSMTIKGGSFSTGSAEEDLTYASIYVGTEHAGEKVTIQIYYSRDGTLLNHGNMVPNHVKDNGYIDVKSADAYKYYPDFAEINLYDETGTVLLDSQSVSLSPESGTQTF